jgi:hypothetical protein
MIHKILTTFCLGMALSLTGPAGHGAPPAAAQSCLSQGEVQAAVQSGQAVSLANFLGTIKAATGGGEVLSSPMLCNVGGQLVYVVNVLSGGQVTRLHVNAQTGAISY